MLVTAAKDGTFPSKDGNTCAYRGENGKKCAVGLLLTDEEVRLVGNNTAVNAIPHRFPSVNLNERVEGLDVRDLTSIQFVHDSLAWKPEWDADAFIERLKNLSCFKEFATCPTS